MSAIQRISPCLWFDDQAEQAAEHYVAIFDDSRIVSTQRYTDVGREFHGKEPGAVMTVTFELDGQRFTGLNGGPTFTFSERKLHIPTLRQAYASEATGGAAR